MCALAGLFGRAVRMEKPGEHIGKFLRFALGEVDGGITRTGKQLGDKIVVRVNGGCDGGYTYLTEKGKWLLAAYRGMQRELKETADALLEKYFGTTF